MNRNRKKNNEAGAALLIVLLLVATLSFIALAIAEKTTQMSMRALHDRARSESHWRAFGAETLTQSAMERVLEIEPLVMSLDDSWAREPLVIPMDEGGVRVLITDATRCFNVNSLVEDGEAASGPLDEFARLAEHAGIGEFEGQRIGQVISDWIDQDNNRQPQGAEDSFYTQASSPYRTGGALIPDISELRAMRGITRELYAGLRTILCAHPTSRPSIININMAGEDDAPVIAAALGVSPEDVNEIIALRPPGGYQAVEDICAQPQYAGARCPDQVSARLSVKSDYLTTRTEILFNTSVLEVTSYFDLSTGDDVRVIQRRIGVAE